MSYLMSTCLNLVFLLQAVAALEALSISPKDDTAPASIVRRARENQQEEAGEIVALVQKEHNSEAGARGIHKQLSAIPSHLHFTWRINILDREDEATRSLKGNVKAIAGLHPDMRVHFHSDKQCEDALERVHSKELAIWFAKEQHGCYKSDLCRLAVLYETGGFYFDNDFNPIVNVRDIIPPGASLSTVLALTDPNGLDSRYDVYQAFLAASPQHPAIKHAMDLTLAWYKSGHAMDERAGQRQMLYKHPARDGHCELISEEACHQVLPGPVFVGIAIRQWLKVNELHSGQMDQGSCDAGDNCAYLFHETEDLTSLGLLERKQETGWPMCDKEPYHRWCNIAISDSNHKAMGWSRSPKAAEFEGYSEDKKATSPRQTFGNRRVMRTRNPARHFLNAHLMTYSPE